MKYLQFGKEQKPILRLVFLHGYGASAQDLSDFRHLTLSTHSHWIFPEGPLPTPSAPEGRAWFPLKLHLPQNQIQESKESLYYLNKYIKEIQNFIAPFPAESLVLGGFSQGAVMALNLALRMKTPPLGLVFMSGTLFPTTLLQEQKQSFVQGGRFFQSHGQQDSLLDFKSSQQVTSFLKSLSWEGEFLDFAGGHEIPPLVLSSVQKFLQKLSPTHTTLV